MDGICGMQSLVQHAPSCYMAQHEAHAHDAGQRVITHLSLTSDTAHHACPGLPAHVQLSNSTPPYSNAERHAHGRGGGDDAGGRGGCGWGRGDGCSGRPPSSERAGGRGGGAAAPPGSGGRAGGGGMATSCSLKRPGTAYDSCGKQMR
eukprot:361976-Chlamydomonas_euryale.AAC.1